MDRVTRMEEILKGLEKERERKPELAETIDLHHALILAQAEAPVPLPHLELVAMDVAAREAGCT